mgnify:CR=1 FL=1
MNREELAEFIKTLVAEHRSDSKAWANHELVDFLEAMAAWVEDMDGYYVNCGEDPPEMPSWRTFADILAAARSYE